MNETINAQQRIEGVRSNGKSEEGREAGEEGRSKGHEERLQDEGLLNSDYIAGIGPSGRPPKESDGLSSPPVKMRRFWLEQEGTKCILTFEGEEPIVRECGTEERALQFTAGFAKMMVDENGAILDGVTT